MKSFQKTIDDLSQSFHKTMVEFQANLQSVPATSPTSNIAAQFSAFQTFVVTSLKRLQEQVEVLNRQSDQQETRSRRKILLLHGVPETAKEEASATVVKVIQQYNLVPEFSAAAISRCHRIGKTGGEKPRVLLVKFREQTVRNKIWFNKKHLKGTGITLAEFLTKTRYEVFLMARQQLGIDKCWTKDSQIIVVAPDGKRHAVTSKTELSAILLESNTQEVASAQTSSTAAAPKPLGAPSISSRARRQDKVNKK